MINNAWGGGESLVQLRQEAVDAAADGKLLLTHHPAALFRQQPASSSPAGWLERARDLAQVSQQRRSLLVLLHAPPANLNDEVVQAALRYFHHE